MKHTKRRLYVLLICVMLMALTLALVSCGEEETPPTPDTPATYTVTFDTAGGTAVTAQTVTAGQPASIPNPPTKDNHAFVTWTLNGTNYDFSAPVNADITLVAQWKTMGPYTVTFTDADGATLKTERVNHGEGATAPADPTRPGYAFTGWNKAFDNITQDTTITAQYVRVWNVCFYDADGTTLLGTDTVRDGEAATAPANPTKEHHDFAGWNMAFDHVTSDLTIKATYTEHQKYTVTFVDYDGTELKKETVYTGKSATAPVDPTRENYTFSGWDKAFDNITADTTVTAQYTENAKYTITFVDYDGTELKKETVYTGKSATAPADPIRENYMFIGWDKAFDNITEETVVTAQYVENGKIKVTFVDYDGTVLGTDWVYEGDAATAPEDPTRDHFDFTGWDKTFDNITEETVVTAQYTEHTKYTVTFKDHDGTTLFTDEVYEGEAATAPNAPTHTGYVFVAWDKAFDNITGETVVTAQCTRVHTVIFQDHDGTELKKQQVEHGLAATAPANPSRDGYTFLGWTLNDTLYQFETPITEDITLVATYEQMKNSYVATYVDENGNVLKTEVVTLGNTPTPPPAPYKAHHAFDKWAATTDPATDDVTYSATYALIRHVVTFNHANGTGDKTPVTVDDCTSVTAQPAPTYSGFAFAYWMTDKGEQYDFSTYVTKDITLTAKYEIVASIPEPTVGETVVYISPGYLEFYMGIDLQLNIEAISSYTAANGKTTSGSYDVNYQGFAYTFYTDRPDIISITADGTITPVALGTARVWARIDVGGTQTVDDTAYLGASYDDFTIADGTVLPAIEVQIIEKPAYLQLAEANPDTQQIQLGKDAAITIADYLSKPTGEYGSANIALWYNDATAVMTLTVDDNIVGDFNQWNAWLEEYGVPFSIFVISRAYDLYGNRWADMTAIGNEVQPHGQIHAASKYYSSGYFTSAQAWHDSYTSKKVVEATTGNLALTLSYPCGYNADFNKILYIGGRAVGTIGVNASNTDYNNVHIPGLPFTNGSVDIEKFNSLFDSSINNKYYPYGGWLNALQHNIGTDASKYEEFLPIAKERMDSGELWAALFSAACQYGQERDTARILNMNAGENVITFNLTDNMNDLLFDHALTVKIKVDSTWTGARAYQNGQECETRIVTDDGETYVYVNAVPDKGEVKVIRSGVENLSQTDNLITFTPTGIVGDVGEDTMTLSFVVDAATWTHGYGMQNGAYVPTTVTTKAGVTYVTVTVKANGGEVSIVPLTDQYDARDSLTMYEVWSGFITPDGTKPVLISSADDLVMFSDYVRNHGYNTGVTFKLTQDIDMSSVDNFLPIGWQTDPDSNGDTNAEAPFCGIFEGNGYTIYNLHIYNESLSYIGLFGYTKNATVTRLNVIGSMEGLGRVGGIVGRMFGGSMNSVTFTGSVTSRGDAHFGETGARVGGLIGQANSVTVTNCAAYASVTAYAVGKNGTYLNRPDGADCGSKVGGIVGELYYKHGLSDINTFNNIVFEGTVTAHAAPGDTGAVYVGGFSGYLIETNATNVTINATVTGRKNVGGFTGAMEHQNYRPGNIKNCSVNGSVTGDDYVAGFAGKIEVANPLKLYNCFVAVEVNVPDTAENIGAVYGASPYGSDIGSSHNTTTKGIYFVSSLNPGMAAHPGTIKDATANCIEVADAESALTGLNTYATTSGLPAWRLDEGIPSAAYFPIFTVTILDKDGGVLDAQTVGKGQSAAMPEAPFITGFEFDKWSADYTNITSNLTIQAIYRTVETFTVTFLDNYGGVIATEVVNTGRGATAPVAPEHERLWLVGWDKAFDNVTENLIVNAQYIEAFYVTFAYKAADGTDITTVIKVPKNGAAEAPELPVLETSRFDGWNKTFDNVTEDITVTANYTTIDTSPITLNIMHWSLNSAPSEAYFNTFTGSDIIIYNGSKDVTASSLPAGWAVVSVKHSNQDSTLTYSAIIYNTAKYTLDTTAGTFAKAPLSGITNGSVLAVPLLDNTSNQQVVVCAFSLGAWAEPAAFGSGQKTTKALSDILPSIAAQFPNAAGIVLGVRLQITRENAVNTGRVDAYTNSDSTTAYVAGYDMVGHTEVTTNNTSNMVVTFMQDGRTATVTNATTVDATDGISTNNGIRYSVTFSDAE